MFERFRAVLNGFEGELFGLRLAQQEASAWPRRSHVEVYVVAPRRVILLRVVVLLKAASFCYARFCRSYGNTLRGWHSGYAHILLEKCLSGFE